MLTFGSLFAGIGGFDLGFERAGMECKWQVEIDPYCQKVLAKHWPNVRRHDDVRTWPQPDTELVDIIVGGFPCQDISYAGKGAGLAGERSGLFYEVARIASEMGPRIIVLENVAALLTRGMGDVLGTLASLGYDAEWHCIPAAAVGAPHIRDRVFILAYATSIGDQEWRQSSEGEDKTRKGRAKWSDINGPVCRKWNVSNATSDGRKQGKPYSSGSCERIGTWEKHRLGSGDRWWSVEPALGRVANGIPNRVDRLRGLGNAVVPQVAEFIGQKILESQINGVA